MRVHLVSWIRWDGFAPGCLSGLLADRRYGRNAGLVRACCQVAAVCRRACAGATCAGAFALMRDGFFITGLWRLVRPGMPRWRVSCCCRFSKGSLEAREPARRELNGSLLGALHLLDVDIARGIVRRKIDHPSIDAAQRICRLVADLSYRTDAAQRLVEAVGKSERQTVALGIALHEQGNLGRRLKGVPAATLSRVSSSCSRRFTSPSDLGLHWVGPADRRGDTVRTLVSLLAGDPRHPQEGPSVELQALSRLQRLKPWLEHLRYSTLSQQGVAGGGLYVHAGPQATALVWRTEPANRADLLALTIDQLVRRRRRVGRRTFRTSAFLKDRAVEVAAGQEDYCRNLLLEHLRAD